MKKFLAHKIAFGEAVHAEPQLKITEHDISTGGSLRNIASQISVDGEKLKEFNKWIRRDEIPSDKVYTMVVPAGDALPDFSRLHVAPTATATTQQRAPAPKEEDTLINGLPVIQAHTQSKPLLTVNQQSLKLWKQIIKKLYR